MLDSVFNVEQILWLELFGQPLCAVVLAQLYLGCI